MDFFDLVTEVIDFRSFSNLWYWIVLAILWSTLSHWVLGIPYHLVQRARRGDAESLRDLYALAEINSRRILGFADLSGTGFVAASAFVLSSLAVLGWGYRVEFAQAVILLLMPLILVTALTVHTARRLHDSGFERLEIRLRNHRLMVQGMGIVFIFVTAFWGMYTNVTFTPLR
ncbi:component of SufBCD complex [Roseicyclus persicicus]|uniref:Component of SufBCD complex n=1 Tax=Roseicyclus persicicus TaxID=2650661 RepID=A0A7X6H194_9RHOB|nr:component of SufBCD complex [Roseibacterium persicicum]NKX46191.1 component of SufBCD complex [Roseibacterium persicicum]